jgi:homoserine kinase
VTPLDIQRFPFDAPLYFVLVNPVFEAPTREMRAALPLMVPFKQLTQNCVMGGSLVRRRFLLFPLPPHLKMTA